MTHKERSPITGIRIKDDLWQRIERYHNEYYPGTKFIISSTIMELIELGLELKGIKRNVKSSNEYVTLSEFDAFRAEVTQQIAALNQQLNARLNQPSLVGKVESSGKDTVDTVEKSSASVGDRPLYSDSYQRIKELINEKKNAGKKIIVSAIYGDLKAAGIYPNYPTKFNKSGTNPNWDNYSLKSFLSRYESDNNITKDNSIYSLLFDRK